MNYIRRSIEPLLTESLARGKSILLLGARQTGKTTMLKHLSLSDMAYTLLDPELRLRFEKSPNILSQEIGAYKRLHPSNRLPIITIDEVQKVPALMDAVQLLIDNKEAQFILTGSSVRKLRRHSQFNLLPGRVVNLHLDPFSLLELPTPLDSIEDFLLYGSLPGIYAENDLQTKQIDLESYVKNYLEEEVRGEALTRELGSFSQFLEMAAVESGNQINISKLSQDLGIGRHTIAEYFCILEDCMIAEKIEPIVHTTGRQRLTKSPKYLFFDLGIRRVTAMEGVSLSLKAKGIMFEQFVGLELLRGLRNKPLAARLRYWRDHAGPEVDYVLEREKEYIPVEVKWTETPTKQDAKHLVKFMQEYSCQRGYIICRCPRPMLIHENVYALPWQQLHTVQM